MSETSPSRPRPHAVHRTSTRAAAGSLLLAVLCLGACAPAPSDPAPSPPPETSPSRATAPPEESLDGDDPTTATEQPPAPSPSAAPVPLTAEPAQDPSTAGSTTPGTSSRGAASGPRSTAEAGAATAPASAGSSGSAAPAGPAGGTDEAGQGTGADATSVTAAPESPLFDSSLTAEERGAALANLSEDEVIAQLGGEPTVAGDDADRAAVRTSVVTLAELSPTHALEMRSIIGWETEIRIDHASTGGGAYSGNVIWIPPIDDPHEPSGILAHEAGHAVFDQGGYDDRIQAELERRGLDDGSRYGNISGIMNEAFAGSFGNRVELHQHGREKGNPDYLRNLPYAADVEGMVTNSDNAYHGYVGPGTEAELGQIREIAATEVLPALRADYGLAEDPDLGQGI